MMTQRVAKCMDLLSDRCHCCCHATGLTGEGGARETASCHFRCCCCSLLLAPLPLLLLLLLGEAGG